jgi:hypothetical protein
LFTDKNSFLSQYDRLRDMAAYDSLVANLKQVVHEKYSPAAFENAMETVVVRFL